MNQTTLRPRGTLRVGLKAGNPGPASNADFYFGVLLPDGVTAVFITSLSPLSAVVARLDANPQLFQPLASNILISQALDVALDDIFVFTLSGSEPPGLYVFFAVLTPPSAFADGRVDADDILAIDAHTIALPISEDAETLVIEFNQNPYGAITRWVKFPFLVWAAPGFSRADLERAISLWEDAVGSAGLDFQITDDRSRANIVFEFGPLPPQATCGVEGPTRITNHVIEAGHGTYSAAPECTGPGNAAATALAHGLGHILGFAGTLPRIRISCRHLSSHSR